MPAFDMDQARVKTIKKLQKKLAKYKEIEIEKMVEEKWDEATDKIASQLATALAENEKLKKQKTKKIPEGFVMIEEKSFDKVAKDLMKVAAEKKQLVEENKKLKEKLEFQTESWEKGWETGKSDTWDEVDKLQEEIKKLKAENEAKEKQMKTLVEYSNSLTVQANADNDSLQEENEEIKAELLYYQFYTYTLDKSGDCDLTKDDVDNFTDSKVHRKTLYDAIGYDD